MGIRIQADPEPLRNLLRRSDNLPFMQIGVPATGFIFGYAPGGLSASDIALLACMLVGIAGIVIFPLARRRGKQLAMGSQ